MKLILKIISNYDFKYILKTSAFLVFHCFINNLLTNSPKTKKEVQRFDHSPDRREHPFLLPLALASGNEKDVEGWQENGF